MSNKAELKQSVEMLVAAMSQAFESLPEELKAYARMTEGTR